MEANKFGIPESRQQRRVTVPHTGVVMLGLRALATAFRILYLIVLDHSVLDAKPPARGSSLHSWGRCKEANTSRGEKEPADGARKDFLLSKDSCGISALLTTRWPPMIGRSAGVCHGPRAPRSSRARLGRPGLQQTWWSRPLVDSPVARRLCSKSDLKPGSASGQAFLATRSQK